MKTITFHSFANGVRPFAVVVPCIDLGNVAQHAKKGGKLGSKGIGAALNDPRKGHAQADTGVITVGAMDRVVGRFTISENTTQI